VNEAIEQQVEERTGDLAHANRQLDALRAEAESQLAAIVRSSGDAIIGKTLNGLIRSWNAGAERIYGYTSEEIVGRSVSMLCPLDRVGEVPAILERVHRGEHVHNFETVRRRKDGKTIDVSLTVSPMKDGEGNIIALSTIARDITESKRIEAALRESEARFHMMADTAPVMVWMAGPDTKRTFVNKRWLEFTGRAFEQELGDVWVSGVHSNDLQRCMETITTSFKTEQPFTMEYRLRRSDGEYRWVIDTGVPLFDHDGRLSGYIGTCIDVTERKDMEDQLRKTVKEKESLLREVHHRVKNNLQVISSLLNLQAASIKDPQVAQLFRECQTRITSIALLHETLHRSKDLSCIRMSDYLRTLTGHVFRSYGVDPKNIALDLLVGDLEFDIDTGMTCGLIVEELVSNCLKHAFVGGKGGRIQIELQAQDEGAYLLQVSDDGVGIPKNGVLHNPDSLGLELVTLLAEKLEGAVELQSGQGTAWRIEFQQLHYQERM
jgi:PAS domain S-box-containing protein